MAKTKLFVGGLSWDTGDDGLRAAFESFGEVTEATVVTERDSGRSRGFGFVSFADAEAAQRAIEEMDGAELDGRRIRVNEAHDKRGGGGGRRGGGGRGGNRGSRGGGGGGGGGRGQRREGRRRGGE